MTMDNDIPLCEDPYTVDETDPDAELRCGETLDHDSPHTARLSDGTVIRWGRS